MAGYDDFILYEGIQKDLDKVNKLSFGSEEWKRVSDSIDKRYNTMVNEARLGNEIEERQGRLELEKYKFDRDAEIREKEIEQAERRSKRDLIGKIAGIGAGLGIVVCKIIYDNSESITDKFTLDAGAKMISGK